MCSKFKICAMPRAKVWRLEFLTFEGNGSNWKARMFLDNNISIYTKCMK
jgi:hypothetical protein